MPRSRPPAVQISAKDHASLYQLAGCMISVRDPRPWLGPGHETRWKYWEVDAEWPVLTDGRLQVRAAETLLQPRRKLETLSLIRTGIGPAYELEWYVVPMKPGEEPVVRGGRILEPEGSTIPA